MNTFSVQRFAPWAAVVIVSLACSAAALAQTPTSPSYRMPVSAINNGVGDMGSASYRLVSSVDDTSFTGRQSGASADLYAGFWHAVIGGAPGCVLDVDGNGVISATSDGLMILRAMLGLTDTAVTQGATVLGAPRTTWTQIAPFVRLSSLNIDGSGNASPATDGVLLLRAMFGLTGTAITNGITTRTWADIRTYLNSQCGGSFAP